jgi:hypothetical protein
MITPTIGRVVLFRYNKEQEQPHPALVCHINEDGTINVGGFTDKGIPFSQDNVPLLQDDDPIPDAGLYAEWMPYQKAKAAEESAKVPLEPVKL